MMITEHFFFELHRVHRVFCSLFFHPQLCTDFANNKCSMIAYIYSKQRIFIITANWNDSELGNNIIVTVQSISTEVIIAIPYTYRNETILRLLNFLWLQSNTHTHNSHIWPLYLSYSLLTYHRYHTSSTFIHVKKSFLPLRNDYVTMNGQLWSQENWHSIFRSNQLWMNEHTLTNVWRSFVIYPCRFRVIHI